MRRRQPVRVTATVTYHDSSAWNLLFVQDATAGIFVMHAQTEPLEPGDLVEVTGVTGGDFSPVIDEPSSRKIGQRRRCQPLTRSTSIAR